MHISQDLKITINYFNQKRGKMKQLTITALKKKNIAYLYKTQLDIS